MKNIKICNSKVINMLCGRVTQRALIILSVFAILGILVTGCSSSKADELRKIVLTEKDLPGLYTLGFEDIQTKFEGVNLAEIEIDYKVGFEETNGTKKILQGVALCSRPEMIPTSERMVIKWENQLGQYRVTELENPKIGEFSIATHWIKPGETFHLFSFSKGNKLVKLKVWGADYEFVKLLAFAAEKKIP